MSDQERCASCGLPIYRGMSAHATERDCIAALRHSFEGAAEDLEAIRRDRAATKKRLSEVLKADQANITELHRADALIGSLTERATAAENRAAKAEGLLAARASANVLSADATSAGKDLLNAVEALVDTVSSAHKRSEGLLTDEEVRVFCLWETDSEISSWRAGWRVRILVGAYERPEGPDCGVGETQNERVAWLRGWACADAVCRLMTAGGGAGGRYIHRLLEMLETNEKHATAEMVSAAKRVVAEMSSSDARRAFFDAMTEGWCTHCGGPSIGLLGCRCWDDS